MKKLLGSIITLGAVVATAVPFMAVPAKAQFPADSTLPKEKRSKRRIAPAPTTPAPKTKDGKPDFSGVWGYAGYTSDIAKDYDIGAVPMTEKADKLFKERQANEGIEDPEARCLPTGVPRRDPYPTKVLQMPGLVVVLYEGNIHSYRQIFADGREHPKDLEPTWYGHSIGKWEGDELVVDTVGFNGLTWLDMAGHPASDKLHVVERWSRPDLGHLKQVITIEDPVMYKKPWTVTEITPLMEGQEIMEYICTENERDSIHMTGIRK